MEQSFEFPNPCKNAIPYFRTSDSLREFSFYPTDLIAAYYLRKKGISVCAEVCNKSNGREKAYYHEIVLRLTKHNENMKTKFNFSDEIGSVFYIAKSL